MEALSITVVESAPRLIAYVRRLATLKTLPAVAAASPVWGKLFERNIGSTNVPIAVFIDAAGDALLDGGEVFIDLGVEILAPFEDDLILKVRETPSGRSATALVTGPYQGIETVHRAIRTWCAENGHVPAGPIWEVYKWNQDPALLETRVHYLLA